MLLGAEFSLVKEHTPCERRDPYAAGLAFG
jgi:hypothetical protein